MSNLENFGSKNYEEKNDTNLEVKANTIIKSNEPLIFAVQAEYSNDCCRNQSRIDEIKDDISKKVELYKEQLKQQYKSEMDLLKHNDRIIYLNKQKNIKNQWQKIITEIYQGKHGKGVVGLVNEAKDRNKYRIVRILPINNFFQQKEHKREEFYSKPILNYYDFLKSDESSPEYRDYAEVSTEHVPVSNEEYNELFEKMKYEITLNTLTEIFPDGFAESTIRDDELLHFGSCNHHSGDIYGNLKKLPTGRFAVLSVYSGEYSSEDAYSVWGVLPSTHTEPSWSARSGCWTGEDLLELTSEETSYLEKKGYISGDDNDDNDAPISED